MPVTATVINTVHKACKPRRDWLSSILCLLFFALGSQSAVAEDSEFRFAVGALSLGGYVDIQFLYQPDRQSPWVYGLRYLSGTETFEDPFTGNPLSDDEDTVYGASLFYLFSPQKSGSFYAGVGIYRYSLTVTSRITSESATDAAVGPFIGGGYMARLGKSYFYNIGVMAGLGGSVKTTTSVTEDEKTGVDPQLMIGVIF